MWLKVPAGGGVSEGVGEVDSVGASAVFENGRKWLLSGLAANSYLSVYGTLG